MTGDVYGELESCPKCGRPMSEYVDHGSHGKFHCWWCNERTADETHAER